MASAQDPTVSIRVRPELLDRLEKIGLASSPVPVKRHAVIVAALEEYVQRHPLAPLAEPPKKKRK